MTGESFRCLHLVVSCKLKTVRLKLVYPACVLHLIFLESRYLYFATLAGSDSCSISVKVP